MYKFAATLLALALATTHGLPDDGHNVQKKDASKGLRGSVGRKLESDGLVCQDGLVCVCHGSCTSRGGTPWIEKCNWGAEHKSGGCKDCIQCETTEAHKEDHVRTTTGRTMGRYPRSVSPGPETRGRGLRVKCQQN